MEALFRFSKSFAIIGSATSQLFKHVSLFGLPVFVAALLKQTIKMLLSFPPTFFYR
jgi:hypothetical protein